MAATAAMTAAVAAPAKPVPSALVAASHGDGAGIARHKPKHKPKHKPAAGPSFAVLGFGVNRAFVANGTTLKAPSACSDMVGGNGYPIGPPQNVYLEAYVRANAIPADAPTRFKDSLPSDDDQFLESSLSPAAPFSRVFGSGLPFGNPPGSSKGIHGSLIVNTDDSTGPSASDFDGTYSWTASVVVGPHTLTSTATATVAC